MKGYAPDTPLVGEITAGPEDATPYLVGNELDGVMNYRLRSAVDGYVRLTNYSDSSGDRATAAGGAAAVHVGWCPMVYYGDEVALDAPGKSGRGDPYNRAPYPWTDEIGSVATYGPPDPETLTDYTVFARVRREFPALCRGAFTTLLTADTSGARGDNDVYAFARSGGADQPVVVVVNKGSTAETARVPLRGLFPGLSNLVDEVKGGAALVAANAVTLTLPPRTGRILVRPN